MCFFIQAALNLSVQEHYVMRANQLKDPSVKMRLYYCGSLEHPDRIPEILKNGFSEGGKYKSVLTLTVIFIAIMNKYNNYCKNGICLLFVGDICAKICDFLYFNILIFNLFRKL